MIWLDPSIDTTTLLIDSMLPARITSYMHRFHKMDVARSTVHRILIRYGMNRLPANQKRQPTSRPWHRYEKAHPGHRLQIDVRFLERIAGSRKRLYQFTAIDDCTRIRVLKIYDVCNQKSAISFVDEVIRRLPFRVLVIQTDNGAEFQSNFHWHLEEHDIRHVYIRPRTPRLNGKVERSHRVDEQEFYQLLDKDGIGDDIHRSTTPRSGGDRPLGDPEGARPTAPNYLSRREIRAR